MVPGHRYLCSRVVPSSDGLTSLAGPLGGSCSAPFVRPSWFFRRCGGLQSLWPVRCSPGSLPDASASGASPSDRLRQPGQQHSEPFLRARRVPFLCTPNMRITLPRAQQLATAAAVSRSKSLPRSHNLFSPRRQGLASAAIWNRHIWRPGIHSFADSIVIRGFSSSSTPVSPGQARKPPKSAAARARKLLRKTSNELVAAGKDITIKIGYGFFSVIRDFCRNPLVVVQWWGSLKAGSIHAWHWTKRGFQLFGANFRISVLLVKKKLSGQPLSFREHKLLVRTTADLVKLIPFSFFVLVPFAELLLPVALWFFPGMLPSTFSEKRDVGYLEKRLKAKQDLAQFFQEMISERTRQVLDETTNDLSRDRALALKEFQEKLISKSSEESRRSQPEGEMAEAEDNANPFLSLQETLTYAKLFREEFKLENMPTKALMAVCRMLGIQPYGIRGNVILQLRHHILRLQREDREILWEGVENLTHEELVEACKDRVMPFYGVSDDTMRDELRQWMKLSSHRDIPPLLLLWSRSFTMTHSLSAAAASAATGAGSAAAAVSGVGGSGVGVAFSPGSATAVGDSSGAGAVGVVPESLGESQQKAPTSAAVEAPVEEVDPSELLPVLDEEAKTEQEKKQEEREKKLQKVEAALQEADKRLELLRSEAEMLQRERDLAEHPEQATEGATAAPAVTETLAERSSEVLTDKAKQLLDESAPEDGGMSHVELVRVAKEDLVRKYEKLEREMNLLRNVSDMQHKHTAGIMQTLSDMIVQLRAPEHEGPAELVEKLEGMLKSFEEGVREISNVMESARCVQLSTDDETYYPSESEDEAEPATTDARR